MVDNPAPVPCPKCGSVDTDVVRMRVEYKRSDCGDKLSYSAGIRDMRCKRCGTEFQSQFQTDDDPPRTGSP